MSKISVRVVVLTMAVGCNETEGEVQCGHDRQQRVIGEQETDDKDITRCVM